MEVVPRLPMLSFDFAQISNRNLSFGPDLRYFIKEFYQEDPKDFESEIQELDSLRLESYEATRDLEGLALLKRYACQLFLLQRRFPMLKDESPPFESSSSSSWKDYLPFANSKKHLSFKAEFSRTLHNIGSLHTYLGAAENRETPKGLKMACTHFQCATYVFQYLQKNDVISSPVGTDEITLEVFVPICLAQAQECILEKSITDHRKYIITAKVACKIHHFYSVASTELSKLASLEQIGYMNRPYRSVYTWMGYLKYKMAYFECITLLFLGLQAETDEKMGLRITCFDAALDKLKGAFTHSKNISEYTELYKGVKEALNLTWDVMEGRKKSAINENNFIYHQEVPGKEAIPNIEGAVLVHPTAFSFNDTDISGPDIFEKLVLSKRREMLNIQFSEERTKLFSEVTAKIEEKDRTYENLEQSYKISLLRNECDDFKENRFNELPEELIDRCAACEGKPDLIPNLITAMDTLANLHHDVDAMMSEILTRIENEEAYEEEYKEITGPRPPSILTTELKCEARKYQEALNKASDSNEALHQAIRMHISNLKVLSLPLEELEQQLPRVVLDFSNEEKKIIQKISNLIDSMEDRKTQRKTYMFEYEQGLIDDEIALRSTGSSSVEVVEKLQELTKLLTQNMDSQDKLIMTFTDVYANYAPIRQNILDQIQDRKNNINALIESFDMAGDVLQKAQKGIDFYKKLETNGKKLQQKVLGYCKVQNDERTELYKVKIRKEATASENQPKLKDYLNSKSRLQTGGKSYDSNYAPTPTVNAVQQPTWGYAQQYYNDSPKLRTLQVNNNMQQLQGYSNAAAQVNGMEKTNVVNQGFSSQGVNVVNGQNISQGYSSSFVDPSVPYNATNPSYPAPTGSYSTNATNPSYPAPSGQQTGSYKPNTTNPGYPAPSGQPTGSYKPNTTNPSYPAPSGQPTGSYNPNATNPDYPATTGQPTDQAYKPNIANSNYPATSVGPTSSYVPNPTHTNYSHSSVDNLGRPNAINSNYTQPINPSEPYGRNVHNLYSPVPTDTTALKYNVSQGYPSQVVVNSTTPYTVNQNGSSLYTQYSNTVKITNVSIPPHTPKELPTVPKETPNISGYNSNYYTPLTSMAGVTYPPTSMSGVTYPPTSMSGVTYPPTSMSGVTYPPTSMPGVSYPPTSMSGVTYPTTSVSGVTYPTTSMSGVTYPPTSMSGTTYPHNMGSIPTSGPNTKSADTSYPTSIYQPINVTQAGSPAYMYSGYYGAYQPYVTSVSVNTTTTSSTNNVSTHPNSTDSNQPPYHTDGNYSVISHTTPVKSSQYSNNYYGNNTGVHYSSASNQPPLQMTSMQSTTGYPGYQTAAAHQAQYYSNYRTQQYPYMNGTQSSAYQLPPNAQTATPPNVQNNSATPNVQAAMPQGQNTSVMQTKPEVVTAASDTTPSVVINSSSAAISSSKSEVKTEKNPLDQKESAETKKEEIIPEKKEESYIDLLSDLDFSVSQPQPPPILPTETNKILEKLNKLKLQTSPKADDAIETDKKENFISIPEEKPKIIPVTNVFLDPEILDQFTRDAEKYEKFVERLTTRTLNGPTPLDTIWNDYKAEQERYSKTQSVSAALENSEKNRSSDNVPYDISRVVLPEMKYINASYVKNVSNVSPDFIVTQCPLASTFNDFWTMIWNEQVEVIVCLLNEWEIGRDVYWPKEKNEKFEIGTFIITMYTSDVQKEWTERVFSVANGNSSRVVVHLQLSTWPQMLLEKSSSLVELVSEFISLYRAQRDLSHPAVVHCSSGIGRTGFFVLVATLISEISSSGGIPDLISELSLMSQNRKNLIQDKEQLQFAYQTILNYLQNLLIKHGKRIPEIKKEPLVNWNSESTGDSKNTPSSPIIKLTSKKSDDKLFSKEENKKRNIERFNVGGALNNHSSEILPEPDDPFSTIDPMWSLKKESR